MNPSFLLGITLLALGFGFVVFWHELGHFLAAKWAKVKVEQFAVGFGQAVLCWRKGMGLQVGTTTPKYEKLARAEYHRQQGDEAAPPTPLQLDTAAASIGLGETEYRLNWLPLGGYVKMLGQDDLDPTHQSTDPRSYNRKSIGARMVIVSAGVVMNVILAFAFYCAVFLIGFNSPPAIVGNITPGSPAQTAGLQVGDVILEIDGKTIRDFTKIEFSIPISAPDHPLPIKIERDGQIQTVIATPAEMETGVGNLLQLGLSKPYSTKAVSPKLMQIDEKRQNSDYVRKLPLRPGERIVQFGDLAVSDTLDRAGYIAQLKAIDDLLQRSRGWPMNLTIEDASGKRRTTVGMPVLMTPFDMGDLSVLGMSPRTMIIDTEGASDALKAKIKPDDVVQSVRLDNDTLVTTPTINTFRKISSEAGAKKSALSLVLVRDQDKEIIVDKITPDVSVGGGRRGFGIALQNETRNAAIGNVLKGSAADQAGITTGMTFYQLNGVTVGNWDVLISELRKYKAGETLNLVLYTSDHQERKVDLKLSAADVASLAQLRYTLRGGEVLDSRVEPRKTGNPLTAAWWGVLETRDKIVELYTTLRRILYDRSVSPSNLMGPVGIFHSGSLLANRGLDWLLWFLGMISANLAVVNFLPLPIVDGGLFCFLLLEKFTGRPPSPRLQQATQLVGLAMILSLFLFVTYNDIYRFFLM